MADRDAAFGGTIPEHYDRHLGPLLFHDMADEMAARLDVPAGARGLETACGTGIVTRRLLGRLGGGGPCGAPPLPTRPSSPPPPPACPHRTGSNGVRPMPRACRSTIAPSTRSSASSAGCSSRTRQREPAPPSACFGRERGCS